MFGYVRYDYPNLFIKDFMLYKAVYCGLCKGIASSCGQKARLGLTYDVAFLSALLHNIAGIDLVIEQKNCFEHAIKKRPIAKADEMTRELGALNTVLVYYKLVDDAQDHKKGRTKRLWFQKGFKKAKKAYPELVEIIEHNLREQARVEKANSSSPDEAAEPSANMMRELSVHFLKDKSTEFTQALFYGLGKWVYLIDALDDYEKDGEKGNYNPFVQSYGANKREALMQNQGKEITFLFDTLFYSIRENLAKVRFYFNRDLTDNIILRGLPIETARVMKGEARIPQKEQVKIK